MATLPKIETTTDYDKFVLHPMNRLVTDGGGGWVLRKDLVSSMKAHGFIETRHIVCERTGHGKLKIICGHNRYVTARALKLPVYFVAWPLGTFDDEAPGDSERTVKAWTMNDYVRRYIHAGVSDYAELDDFCKSTGISMNTAASLLMGHMGESGNANSAIKAGTWRISDSVYAWYVAGIAREMLSVGKWATSRSCVSAISRIARVKNFDVRRFKDKIRKFPFLFSQQRNSDDYVRLFDEVYNYMQKGAKFELFTETQSVMRARNIGGLANKKQDSPPSLN